MRLLAFWDAFGLPCCRFSASWAKAERSFSTCHPAAHLDFLIFSHHAMKARIFGTVRLTTSPSPCGWRPQGSARYSKRTVAFSA